MYNMYHLIQRGEDSAVGLRRMRLRLTSPGLTGSRQKGMTRGRVADAVDSYLAYGHYLQGVGALVVEGVGVDVVGDQTLGRL